MLSWLKLLKNPPHPGHQQTASSMHYTTSCKHSLVLLRMGEIIFPKHVELIEIINKVIIVASSWLCILYIYIYIYICFVNNSYKIGPSSIESKIFQYVISPSRIYTFTWQIRNASLELRFYVACLNHNSHRGLRPSHIAIFPFHATRAYRGVEVYLYSFLTSTPDWGERLTSHTSRLTHG